MKNQVHEEFRSFTGNSIKDISEKVSEFVRQEKVAAKSLSVQRLGGGRFYVVSVGYRPSDLSQGIEPYPVKIEVVDISEVMRVAISRLIPFQYYFACVSSFEAGLGLADLDKELVRAEGLANGDVICHSLFFDEKGDMKVAFLVYPLDEESWNAVTGHGYPDTLIR